MPAISVASTAPFSFRLADGTIIVGSPFGTPTITANVDADAFAAFLKVNAEVPAVAKGMLSEVKADAIPAPAAPLAADATAKTTKSA